MLIRNFDTIAYNSLCRSDFDHHRFPNSSSPRPNKHGRKTLTPRRFVSVTTNDIISKHGSSRDLITGLLKISVKPCKQMYTLI